MPSEVDSVDPLEGDEEQHEEGLQEEPSNDLSDGRALNFKGAIIRDASNPGDGGAAACTA